MPDPVTQPKPVTSPNQERINQLEKELNDLRLLETKKANETLRYRRFLGEAKDEHTKEALHSFSKDNLSVNGSIVNKMNSDTRNTIISRNDKPLYDQIEGDERQNVLKKLEIKDTPDLLVYKRQEKISGIHIEDGKTLDLDILRTSYVVSRRSEGVKGFVPPKGMSIEDKISTKDGVSLGTTLVESNGVTSYKATIKPSNGAAIEKKITYGVETRDMKEETSSNGQTTTKHHTESDLRKTAEALFYQETRKSLADMFGRKDEQVKVTERNGVDFMTIPVASSKDGAEGVIDRLIPIRAKAGMGKQELPFLSDEQGNLLLRLDKLVDVSSNNGFPELAPAFKKFSEYSGDIKRALVPPDEGR